MHYASVRNQFKVPLASYIIVMDNYCNYVCSYNCNLTVLQACL